MGSCLSSKRPPPLLPEGDPRNKERTSGVLSPQSSSKVSPEVSPAVSPQSSKGFPSEEPGGEPGSRRSGGPVSVDGTLANIAPKDFAGSSLLRTRGEVAHGAPRCVAPTTDEPHTTDESQSDAPCAEQPMLTFGPASRLVNKASSSGAGGQEASTAASSCDVADGVERGALRGATGEGRRSIAGRGAAGSQEGRALLSGGTLFLRRELWRVFFRFLFGRVYRSHIKGGVWYTTRDAIHAYLSGTQRDPLREIFDSGPTKI